jgi:hypothetical protein
MIQVGSTTLKDLKASRTRDVLIPRWNMILEMITNEMNIRIPPCMRGVTATLNRASILYTRIRVLLIG